MLTNDSSVHQQQHEMQLEKTHPSGADEWYCPTCGRRFLLCWPPAYKKIIIEAGDEYVVHSAGKGGLRMGLLQIKDDEEPLLSDELRAAIEEVLEDIDFDDWDHSPA
jgi:hypothetical protein